MFLLVWHVRLLRQTDREGAVRFASTFDDAVPNYICALDKLGVVRLLSFMCLRARSSVCTCHGVRLAVRNGKS